MIFDIKTVKSEEMVKNINRISLVFITMLVIICSSVYVSAIAANLGNARMVLHANTGDIIEKTVLVKNVNNETINIEAAASGDLASDVTIKNPKFSLAEGEEKNIELSIKVKKEGTTETKINVKFISQETQKGVGLSSTIIVIAGEGTGFPDEPTTTEPKTNTNSKLTLVIVATVATIILVILLGLLYLFSKKRSEQKDLKIKPKKESEKK
ncbi:Uncharacterised protein [uncultured archaeon]|nr:Uncharacterised protein [uncultured archaeon]